MGGALELTRVIECWAGTVLKVTDEGFEASLNSLDTGEVLT